MSHYLYFNSYCHITYLRLGIYLFFWAVKTEQFDDLEKQGMSILFDEEMKTQIRTFESRR